MKSSSLELRANPSPLDPASHGRLVQYICQNLRGSDRCLAARKTPPQVMNIERVAACIELYRSCRKEGVTIMQHYRRPTSLMYRDTHGVKCNPEASRQSARCLFISTPGLSGRYHLLSNGYLSFGHSWNHLQRSKWGPIRSRGPLMFDIGTNENDENWRELGNRSYHLNMDSWHIGMLTRDVEQLSPAVAAVLTALWRPNWKA